jgi:hypothetical protein
MWTAFWIAVWVFLMFAVLAVFSINKPDDGGEE